MMRTFNSIRIFLKIFFVLQVLVCSASAFAHEAKEERRLQASCGPQDIKFDVHTTKSRADATTEPDRAEVYIAEIFVRPPFPVSGPTVRVGVDGNWIGAVHGSSYVAFSVAPGEHHVCMQRQSFQKGMTREAAFTSFTAEAGKRYYFRAHFAYNAGLDLETVDPEEGQYLTSHLGLSVSRPKK